METVEQLQMAMQLVIEANKLYNRLRIESAGTDDETRRERIKAIRRKMISRMNRRDEAYRALVYGEVQP